LNLMHTGVLLSLRFCTRSGSFIFVFGLLCLSFLVSLSECCHMGLALSLRSLVYLGLPLPTSDSLQSGSVLPFRSLAHLDFLVFIFSSTRLRPSLAVPDPLELEATLSMRSFACFGSTTSIPNYVHTASTMFLRGFSRLVSALSIFGMTCLDLSVSPSESVHMRLLLPSHSSGHLGSAMSVLDSVQMGSALLLNFLG
jgi:hypothetical protein